ncbi:Uncharacterised protein [Serratia fonticola]|nr:Uncharacterised protein [Serratia fonticola]
MLRPQSSAQRCDSGGFMSVLRAGFPALTICNQGNKEK